MKFEDYVNALEETLCSLGNVQTKNINYGVQIILTGSGKKVTLNIYNGKKGIRLVWGGGDSGLQGRAIELVRAGNFENASMIGPTVAKVKRCSPADEAKVSSGSPVPGMNLAEYTAVKESIHGTPKTCILLADEPDFTGIWMGSDESGKGDYFGPLVVAAVCLDVKGGEALLMAGVKDCKTMSDIKISALAETIEKTALACSVLIMKPQAYNMRYEQMQQQGGNLNTLLALGHVAALKQTWQKYPQCRQALVDQFAKNESISAGVQSFAPELQVRQRPRAEEDIAVAAASVLARAAFLKAIQEMEKEAGIGRIPKGGGEAATNAARRLTQKQGMEVLGKYVKLHFANTQKL